MIVFDHIPKTGGTTLHSAYLPTAFDESELFILSGQSIPTLMGPPDPHDRDFERLAGMTPAERGRFRVIAGHGMEPFRLIEPTAPFVSLMRDPVEWEISSYLHYAFHPDPGMQSLRESLPSPFTLRQFVDLELTVPNAQARILLGSGYPGSDYETMDMCEVSKRLRERYSALGVTEDLGGFIYLLHLTQNFPLCLFRNQMVRPERAAFRPDPSEVELILRKHRFDAMLYRIVRQDFLARLDSLLTPMSAGVLSRFHNSLEHFQTMAPETRPAGIRLAKDARSWGVLPDYYTIFEEVPPGGDTRPVCLDPSCATGHSTLTQGPRCWVIDAAGEPGSVAARIPVAGSFNDGSVATLNVLLRVTSGNLACEWQPSREGGVAEELSVTEDATRTLAHASIDLRSHDGTGYLVVRKRSEAGCSSAEILAASLSEARVQDGLAALGLTTPEPGRESQPVSPVAPTVVWPEVMEIPLWNVSPWYRGGLVVDCGELILTTDERQWAYSAIAKFEIPGIQEHDRAISIDISVHDGILGIGWLTADESAWVQRVIVEAEARSKKVRLIIPKGTVGGSLIFHNATPGGTPAKAAIQGIRIMELEALMIISSLVTHSQKLKQLAPEVRDALLELDDAGNLSFAQGLVLAGAALHLRPDLILDIGTGGGNSAIVFALATRGLGTRIATFDVGRNWPPGRLSAESRFRGELTDAVTAVVGDVTEFDWSTLTATADRILIFWDAHGFAVAECILAKLMPLVADKSHFVICHDMSPNSSLASRSYNGKRMWRGMSDFKDHQATTARVCLGWVATDVDQIIPILDFCWRNNTKFRSLDEELQDSLDQRSRDEAIDNLGLPRSTTIHMGYFTLNETKNRHFPALG